MVALMQQMEPRRFEKGEIIYHDMEDVEEIIFVLNGAYAVGYTVNSVEYLALKLGPKTVIGDQSVMFLKRSEFLYKALDNIDCQAIRKSKYQEVQDKYGAFSQKLKIKVFQRYKDLIRRPSLEHKQETIAQI